jgi:branched-chain amino acid transport system substrate-binding protein
VKKRLVLCAILAIMISFCFLLGSCTKQKNASGKVIKIGVVAPFEGKNAHIGEIIFNSVNLFYNSAKPIPNLHVKLVPIDSKSSPTAVVAAVQTAVADPDIVAIIGFYHSSTALASKQIIREAKVPTLIYSASNPSVTDDTSYYFRLVPTDDNQAIVLADYAKKIGAKSVAILYFADEYGKGLHDGIKATADKIGIKVVSSYSYDESTNDFRPVLSVIKSKKPDAIIICGFVEKSIDILNHAAEKGMKGPFLTGDGTFNEEQLIKGAGANAEGVYVAAPYVFNESNPANKKFLEDYWAAYDKDQSKKKPASWAAFAYDAADILYKAIQQGKTNRQDIQGYLKAINSQANSQNGITGSIYFNSKGDAVGKKFRLARVKEGKFVAVE